MKTCSVCKLSKSLDNFYNQKLSKDGLYPRCKDCDKLASQKYRLQNLERFKTNHRNRYVRYRYKLEPSEYQELLSKQNSVCLICGRDNDGWNLAVDHNHDTGEVRGLLCNTCNRAIGMLQDSPALLRVAADYLEGVGNGRGNQTH